MEENKAEEDDSGPKRTAFGKDSNDFCGFLRRRNQDTGLKWPENSCNYSAAAAAFASFLSFCLLHAAQPPTSQQARDRFLVPCETHSCSRFHTADRKV